MSPGNGVSDLFISVTCVLLFPFIDFVGGASLPRTTSIVYMDKSQMPKPFASHHHWYSSAVGSLRAGGSEKAGPSLLYSYDNAVHGFSALLSRGELAALKSVPGFVSAHSDKELTLETTHTPEFLSLNAASGLWPASDYGRDVIIGVIDTGVWPESKSFDDGGMKGDQFPIPSRWKGVCEEGEQFKTSMCNSKLIGARSFSRGLRARDGSVNISMSSARDTDGHGTHTAATAAGNYVPNASFFGYASGTARGIAPRARLAVYKPFWDEGAAESDFLAAFDQAVADGVDVISLSFGFPAMVPLYENAIAIAAFGAMEKGVFVSTSAGNQGPPLGSISKGIPWALVVAAGTTDRRLAGTLTLGNGLTVVGWTMFPARTAEEHFALVYNKTLSPCNSPAVLAEAPSAAIICDRMGIVSEQLDNVAASSAAAAIFIAGEDEILDLDSFPCAGVVISPDDAAAVIDYARNNRGHPTTVRMRFRQTFTGRKPAPAVARYSSRGPSPSLPWVLKPDVMAPGSQVLAAWIPNAKTARVGSNRYLSSDFNIVSGTSMACPHAAGAAALLKGAHPGWSPAAIRSALMTTATPFDNALDPIRDVGANLSSASPLASGSGQIDPNRALDPGLIYDAAAEDYVKLLCSLKFTEEEILTITRSSGRKCSSNHSADLNYPSFIAFYKFESTARMVRTFRRTVTNVGDGAAAYEAKVTPPRDSAVSLSPETLAFRGKYEKQSYNLTIRYRGNKEGRVSFGSIVWMEVDGKRAVRSPIVVSPPWTAFIHRSDITGTIN